MSNMLGVYLYLILPHLHLSHLIVDYRAFAYICMTARGNIGDFSILVRKMIVI